MNRSRIIYLMILLFSISAPAYAYIDPGSGSLLVSSLIGIVLTLAYALRGVLYQLWAKITGGKIVASSDFSGSLVFFNEGKNYWNVFKPVLQELIHLEKNFVYLTADRDDPGLKEFDSPFMVKQCLGNMQQAILILNRLKADTVVMTTPQLGILQLKRSKNVRHYCHLLHAPIDIHTYKKFAFDYFDSVLCSSTFQIENLRQLEKDRNKPEKQLFKTGCTYYDLVPASEKSDRDAVLLAPTWGDKSFLKECGEKLIDQILNRGHTLIFRPHPQSWISEMELLSTILDRFSSHPGFIVDKSPDNNPSLKRAKIMICDFSGVIYDFVFIQKMPVIAIERDWKDGGYESSDLDSPQSAFSLLEKAGMIVKIEDLDQVCPRLEEISRIKIDDVLTDQYIFNFRNAGKVAARQILSL